jgi:hypothetical protein
MEKDEWGGVMGVKLAHNEGAMFYREFESV